MRILSKTKDYYDSAATFGIDKSCIYKREQTNTVFKSTSSRPVNWPHSEEYKPKKQNGSTYNAKKFVIGFCGQLYPVVKITKTTQLYPTTTVNVDSYFYSASEVAEFLEEEEIGSGKNSKWKSYYWRASKDYPISNPDAMKLFFDPETHKDLNKIFVEKHAPVFIYGRYIGETSEIQLVTNPLLLPYKFAKIKDAHTAFQDIFMYLSGVLGQTPMQEEKMSDKVLADSKGHSGKYSFRKPPGGKRGKPKWR